MPKLTDEQIALAFLTKRRNQIDMQISELQGRRQEVTHLIAELEKPIRSAKDSPIDNDLLRMLQDAGATGISITDVAKVTNQPRGTISSRLSVLKARGYATHKRPRYYSIARMPASKS